MPDGRMILCQHNYRLCPGAGVGKPDGIFMTRRFRIIEHTADIGLVAFGCHLPEAFANAAVGMFGIITDLRKIREREARVVELEEEDAESLLFAWLNELIFLFDVEHLLFRRFVIEVFEERRLRAICYGEKIDRNRHDLKTGIKSATYHTLQVDKEKNRVRVIFDI